MADNAPCMACAKPSFGFECPRCGGVCCVACYPTTPLRPGRGWIGRLFGRSPRRRCPRCSVDLVAPPHCVRCGQAAPALYELKDWWGECLGCGLRYCKACVHSLPTMSTMFNCPACGGSVELFDYDEEADARNGD